VCLHIDIRETWLTDPVCEAAIDFIQENWKQRVNEPDIVDLLISEIPACVGNKNIISVLQSRGTDYLLKQKNTTPEMQEQHAKHIAMMILTLEIQWTMHGYSNDKPLSGEQEAQLHQQTVELFNFDSRLKIVRFFHKRIPCTCLDQVKQEAKAEIEMGICQQCHVNKDDATLFNCARCVTVAKYCSKECQRLAWPAHKRFCDMWVESLQASDGKPFAK
jgi:MYND finger